MAFAVTSQTGMQVVGVGTDPYHRWKTDESYQRLIEEYRRADAAPGGQGLIDEDWADAYRFWVRLDFEQRLAAVKGITARIDAGTEAHFYAKPLNYLEKQGWRREVRPKVAEPPSPYPKQRTILGQY